MNELIEYAKSFLGVQYKYGGRNRLEGLDCSQFVIELLISQGVLPHGFDTNAQGLFDHFVTKSTNEIKPRAGSLAFYGHNSQRLVHVAFCLDETVMIECGGGDHTTITREAAIEKSACVRVRPIKFRKDYFCSLSPKYDNSINPI